MTEKIRLSEEQCVLLLKENNPEALIAIYDTYASAVYGVLLKIAEDKPEADELLIQTFVTFWKNRQTYILTKNNLFAQLLTEARELAFASLHRKTNHIDIKNRFTLSIPSLVEEQSEFNTLTEQHTLKEVNSKLKPEYYKLLVLAYFKGCSKNEIASLLDISEAEVKSNSKMALQQLRDLLKGK